MINWKKIFWSALKKYLRTYNSIWKIATCWGEDYTPGCLLDYPYFKKYYKLIAIDLNKN